MGEIPLQKQEKVQSIEPAVTLYPTSLEVFNPGIDPGFMHCCGTDKHVMQIDCKDHLLRCYERQGGVWNQTYGRVCKASLDVSCYQDGCVSICDNL